MAITFVPCRNKKHAVELRSAGLLYIRFCGDFELAIGLGVGWVRDSYGTCNWPPKDFAYAVED